MRITKDKVICAKEYDQTFSREISRVVNIIQRVPQPVYEVTNFKNVLSKARVITLVCQLQWIDIHVTA